MALAPFFMRQQELPRRMRPICFAFLTTFYFLKHGSLIEVRALIAGAPLIALFLNVKPREGMYATLMMSTGLTFGSLSALFGLTNHIIDQTQYTVLLTAVIGRAVVPTLIAQGGFQPHFVALEAVA